METKKPFSKMTLCKLLLLFNFSLCFAEYETPDMPFLPFKMEGQNTAISGPTPWLIQEFTSKDGCFKTCLQNFTNCGHVQYKEISATRWFCQLYDVIENLFDYLVSKIGETLYSAEHKNIACNRWKEKGYGDSGIFWIFWKRTKMRTWCDMSVENPWILIQRRTSAFDFDRSWEEYKDGFGDPATNFWLGNDKIHKLTHGREMTLRITGVDYSGLEIFVVYKGFYIEDEENRYRLHSGVRERGHNGYKDDWHNLDGAYFSCKGHDNDGRAEDCSADYNGNGWWMGTTQNTCYSINFNRRYSGSESGDGPWWVSWKGYYNTLKETKMEIRHPGD